MKKHNKSNPMRKKQKIGLVLLYGIGIGIGISLIIIMILNNNSLLENSKQIPYKPLFKPISNLKESQAQPFYINLNKVSYDELISFGLKKSEAKNIINYVKSGGRFYKLEDINKLYLMNPELYAKLKPWLVFDKKQEKKIYEENKTNNEFSKPRTFFKSPKIIFDINLADTLDLECLRGIGPSYSRRIINYRNKLGGYISLSQLKEVYGMTDSLYNSIIPSLIIENPNPRKININKCNIKELISHPYLDYYISKSIIKFREDIKGIDSLSQLKLIQILDQETYNKIIPYLEL